jgi:hypothetical protein
MHVFRAEYYELRVQADPNRHRWTSEQAENPAGRADLPPECGYVFRSYLILPDAAAIVSTLDPTRSMCAKFSLVYTRWL